MVPVGSPHIRFRKEICIVVVVHLIRDQPDNSGENDDKAECH